MKERKKQLGSWRKTLRNHIVTCFLVSTIFKDENFSGWGECKIEEENN